MVFNVSVVNFGELCSSHGTRCAGEVAAARDNDVCGVGVAYDSKIAGTDFLNAIHIYYHTE